MIVSGLVRSSLVDYPGQVAAVLFVPGCNYDCFFCHNRSLLDGSPSIIEFSAVMDFLKKRVGLLDGVVISGGEPTLQKGLISRLREVKALGYKIKLDTNGSSPVIVAELLQSGLCDYFAVDYKAPLRRYEEICGSGAAGETVLKTINLLVAAQADFEVRTTVIPQLNEDDLLLMAEELPVVPRYVFNRYRPPEKYLPADRDRVMTAPYPPEKLAALAAGLAGVQPNIVT